MEVCADTNTKTSLVREKSGKFLKRHPPVSYVPLHRKGPLGWRYACQKLKGLSKALVIRPNDTAKSSGAGGPSSDQPFGRLARKPSVTFQIGVG
jgi:hypothetical protein